MIIKDLHAKRPICNRIADTLKVGIFLLKSIISLRGLTQIVIKLFL